ncbi:hypothetical protein [Colwellia piezophila]|uniref:hypothetical protein n=1 Tax=Colwellia piezophila TaxID=211668 RepID=UPI0003819116|nr:hypothetical protein [Colwellia piezophila]
MINTVIITLVVISLVMIITEDLIHLNKAKTTLFFGTLCWILIFIFPTTPDSASHTTEQLNELNFISYLSNVFYLIIAYTVGYIGVYFAATRSQ